MKECGANSDSDTLENEGLSNMGPGQISAGSEGEYSSKVWNVEDRNLLLTLL